MPTGNALLSTQSFNGTVGGGSVCPAPGACLAKVPQMRVTMMITLIHIHDYIYLCIYYTVAIKKLKERASKCDEKQKQTNNRQQQQSQASERDVDFNAAFISPGCCSVARASLEHTLWSTLP